MPMELRSSAMCCQRITNAIRYIYQQFGFDLVPYLDDLATAKLPRRVSKHIKNGWDPRVGGAGRIYSESAQPEHTNGFPGNTIWYHELNSVCPNPTCRETLTILDQWLNANATSGKEIQSVVGKLKFLENFVRPVRLLVSWILEFMRGLPDRGCFPVTDSVNADMRWWNLFLPRYNGISLMAVDH